MREGSGSWIANGCGTGAVVVGGGKGDVASLTSIAVVTSVWSSSYWRCVLVGRVFTLSDSE